ncbi:MAG: HAMP domain-containing histidine kinase, partial [Devosiaceae bacterium]|nr:HAMP domain-containing histidine kinase [Devosiaceae bacterium MH13]
LFGLRHARHAEMRAKASIGIFCVALAVMTALGGGLTSPLAIFFLLPPIEALLTRKSQLAIRTSGLSALAFVAAIAAAPVLAQEAPQNQHIAQALQLLALLYAIVLAFRLVKLANLKDMRLSATQRAIEQFHSVTHDVFAIVRRDGYVQQAFGALSSVLAVDRADLLADGLANRIHIADRPSFLATLDRAFAERSRATVEVRIRTGSNDGPQRFIWTEIDLSAVSPQKGDRSEPEIYALIRDITSVKDHEGELLRARERAEASDAAKGRFLATMSHELRTPLNAIIGFADILDEEVFGALQNDQQREYVGLIRESGGHLLQLVNDLLDMSKLEAGHFHIVAEPFAVGTVIDRCAKLMSSQADKARQRVILDVAGDLPELVADQRAVRQILINLLSNASKFTPEGGTITVRARRDGAVLSIAVIDTGIGLKAEDIKRLGEPFFQADNAYDRSHQGTGLGLSVVRGLCDLHEGSINFTSVEGEGTTATVRLPFAGPSEVLDTPVHRAADNAVVYAKLSSARAQAALEQIAPSSNEHGSEPPAVQEERLKAHA